MHTQADDEGKWTYGNTTELNTLNDSRGSETEHDANKTSDYQHKTGNYTDSRQLGRQNTDKPNRHVDTTRETGITKGNPQPRNKTTNVVNKLKSVWKTYNKS